METPGAPGDVQTRQCSTCDARSARCWCVDCSEALCDDCLAAHRRVTLTRSHRVLSHQPEGPSLISPTKFCRSHPSEELQLFCFTCCRLTCRDCQLTEHQNHRFDFVCKAVESVRKQLDACMQPIRARMEASRRSLQEMEWRLKFLAHCEVTMTSKLQKNVDMLMELLKKRFEEISSQIQKAYDLERSVIAKKMQRVEQLLRSHGPLTEAAEKAGSTTDLPALVGCIAQITSQAKELEDEDARPLSKMLHLTVTTDRSSLEAILNFGKIHVSWVPFTVSRKNSPPSSSSSSPPPSSTSTPASGQPASSSLQLRPGSDAVPPISQAADASRPTSGCGSSAQSSRPAPMPSAAAPPPPSAAIKSRTFQPIQARNPRLCSLLYQTLPSTSPQPAPPPAGLHPDAPPQTSPGLSSLPPSSHTARGSGGSKQGRPSASEGTSKGSDSTVQINVLTKSQLEAHSQRMFVKFQWKSKAKRSSASPKNKILLVRQEPQTQTSTQNQYMTHSQPQTQTYTHTNPQTQTQTQAQQQYNTRHNIPTYTQTQFGSVVLTQPPVQAPPPTYLLLPQVVPTTKPFVRIQPRSPLAPNISLPVLAPVKPSLILNQYVVSSPNQSPVLMLTNTGSPNPALGSGSGSDSPRDQTWFPALQNSSAQEICGSSQVPSVSAGPQVLPGNGPSAVRIGPESNDHHPTTNVGPPVSNLKDKDVTIVQQNRDSKDSPGSAHRVQQMEPEHRTSDGSDPTPEAPESRTVEGSRDASPTERRLSTETRPEELIGAFADDGMEKPDRSRTSEDSPIVLSEDESLLDVYKVKPGFEEVHSYLEPISAESSDNEVTVVENEPSADGSLPEVYEVKPTASRSTERDILGEAASPAASEGRISVDLSEEPELGLKLSSSEMSDSEDENLLSNKSQRQDPSRLYPQLAVSLLRLPLSLPGPGRPLPRYHFILGNQKDELYLQEVEEDSQSSDEDASENATDLASDVTEDFTDLRTPESPLSLVVISCAACGSSSASKICTVCGRGYHRDCHVPPFGPDIWSELVCSLCQDLSDPEDPYSSDRPPGSRLSLQDQRRCETLLLHLKVEGCRRFSQVDLWSDLMLISERLSLHLPPPYQTPGQVVSDLWDLFSDASQGDRLTDLQLSFQRKLEETFGSELRPSLLAPLAADGDGGDGDAVPSRSKFSVLKKRLRDFLDLKGTSAAKKTKTGQPGEASGLEATS